MTLSSSPPLKVIIFTDLDGTLLNAEDYRCDAALPMLQQLQQQKIPVIPVTSKTRREVEHLRQSIFPNDSPQDPFVVENGSAIFGAPGDRRFPGLWVKPTSLLGRYSLGCTYAEARQSLRQLGDRLGETLQGFGDLSDMQLAELTGLSLAEVALAKAREFTEPFLTPRHISPEQLQAAAQQEGMQVVVGDRFCHLIGAGAGKGVAVNLLKSAYRAAYPESSVHTVGLGNSPNDLPMLQAVDCPIVIPGRKGAHPALQAEGWNIAPAPGSEGWARAIATVFEKISVQPDRLPLDP